MYSADWICTGTDSWSNTSCWWEGSIPGAMDSANAFVSTAADTTINYSGNVNSGVQLSDVIMNNSGGGSLIFNRSSDLDLNAYLAVFGTDGLVTVNHSQGSSIFGHAVVGSMATSSAIYNLGNTASIVSDGFTVGNEGQGTMIQSGGTLTVNDTLSIGHVAGSLGSYELSGGTLNVTGTEYVGFFGDGSFTQTGGTHNTGNLHVGRKSGNGIYTLDNGSLNVSGVMEVGTIPGAPGTDTQNAHFVQNGGSLIMTTPGARLTVSASGMANGRYDLNDGALTTSRVINNDTFEYSGGSLNGDFENHDHMILNGPGTRTIIGDLTNVGTTLFEHTYNAGAPDELTVQRTAHGLIELADGTMLNVDGNLVLQAGSTLAIELGESFYNTMAFPWISVSGTTTAGGILDLTSIGGFAPEDGFSWLLLDASLVSGSFDEILFPTIPNWSWELVYGTDNIVLTGYSAVPVPAAAWLFVSGLVGLITVSRRSHHRKTQEAQ